MKKLQILVCALLLGSVSVNAQKKKNHKSSTKPKVEFGIRAGANISKINGDDYSYIFSSKIGYFGGLVVKYPLSKTLSLQGEAYYNMIGSKAKNQPALDPFRVNSKIAYVSVPILFQFKISPEFYLETGPEIGVNLSSKNKNIDTGEVFIMKDTKRITFFWGIGTGYYLTENIAANFRANIGMNSPFFKTVNAEGTSDHFRMNNFQLGLVYYFK
ncbi:porin family protein [Soonwooa sp.]|uniref:porin family protein n=1 Tax=Soonwooa sp. TaxID=1938592 RepID=UPI002618E96C|nr:porin family protein [Soonwooa sp.]